MRNIAIFIFLMVIGASCHQTKIGYLRTEGATYLPDSTIVRTVLDEELDKARIANQAPWVSSNLQGVLGTPPITYRIADVKSPDNGDVTLFRQELVIRGNGVMLVPLVPKSPKGHYVISIEISNEDHSQILEDAFTFIIE